MSIYKKLQELEKEDNIEMFNLFQEVERRQKLISDKKKSDTKNKVDFQKFGALEFLAWLAPTSFFILIIIVFSR